MFARTCAGTDMLDSTWKRVRGPSASGQGTDQTGAKCATRPESDPHVPTRRDRVDSARAHAPSPGATCTCPVHWSARPLVHPRGARARACAHGARELRAPRRSPDISRSLVDTCYGQCRRTVVRRSGWGGSHGRAQDQIRTSQWSPHYFPPG